MFNVLSLMATGFGTTLQLLVLDEEVETAGEGICASSFMLWAVSVALHHTGATATLLPFSGNIANQWPKAMGSKTMSKKHQNILGVHQTAPAFV